jgi:hypothetical protein
MTKGSISAAIHNVIVAEGPEPTFKIGNVGDDAPGHRGWVVGHFIEDATDPRRSSQVEIKWGVHGAGDGQDEWSMNLEATSVSILISGRDLISFPGHDVELSRQGDYVLWRPGIPHRWRALADSVVLTIRWPSKAGDSLIVSDAMIARFAKGGNGQTSRSVPDGTTSMASEAET